MNKIRKNISDNIYDTIKELLLSGELDFSDKIVELEYCEKLNVSRTPLREAIKQLEIEELLKEHLMEESKSWIWMKNVSMKSFKSE